MQPSHRRRHYVLHSVCASVRPSVCPVHACKLRKKGRTRFWIFRLSLNKINYNSHNAAVTELTLQQVFEVTFLCANTTTEPVTPLFDRFLPSRRPAGIQSMSQPSAAATRPHLDMMLDTHAAASLPRCGTVYNSPDLDKECRLATYQDSWTNIPLICRRMYEYHSWNMTFSHIWRQYAATIYK